MILQIPFFQTCLFQAILQINPVSCVGNINNAKVAAFPRMHNKFLIFAKRNNNSELTYDEKSIIPYAVWTGSYNITKNASMSFENALYITDLKIVNAFYKEFAQIIALSESLDWFKDWVEPQWRIGT